MTLNRRRFRSSDSPGYIMGSTLLIAWGTLLCRVITVKPLDIVRRYTEVHREQIGEATVVTMGYQSVTFFENGNAISSMFFVTTLAIHVFVAFLVTVVYIYMKHKLGRLHTQQDLG